MYASPRDIDQAKLNALLCSLVENFGSLLMFSVIHLNSFTIPQSRIGKPIIAGIKMIPIMMSAIAPLFELLCPAA